MQMIHALPGISSGVRHDPIPIGIESLLRGQLGGKRHQPTQQSFTLGPFEVPDRGDMSSRDDQQVHGSLWVDIREGNRLVGALHDLGRNLPGHDSAEQTISHASPAFVLYLQSQPRRGPRSRIAEY